MKDTFARSYETSVLVDALRALAPGELITYAQLSGIIQSPIAGTSSCLISARQIVEREDTVAFAAERSIGIRRLADAEIVKDTFAQRAKIHRGVRRAMHRLGSVRDYDAMSPSDKASHTAHAVIYTVLVDESARGKVTRAWASPALDGHVLLAALRDAAKR